MGRFDHIRRTIEGVKVSNLFDPPGRPFGWAHNEERRIIREHLQARGRQGWNGYLEFEVSKIQQRLHRSDLKFRELQVLYKRRWARQAPPEPNTKFTREELQALVDYFGEANNPVTASIGAKAFALLLEK